LFSAPGPGHLFAQANHLPVLTVIYNNSGYEAVRRVTRAIHPGGAAQSAENVPLTDIGDTSGLHRVVEAFGGYGERVDRPELLAPALERAMAAVEREGRQAVLNVTTAGSQ
jgi:acetolactate synthase-1/2/3 large subunit